MKEEICVGGELLAIVVKDVGSYDSDQINFFTDGSLPLQAGVFNRPKDHYIQAHEHKETGITVSGFSEAILILKGKMTVHLALSINDREKQISRRLSECDLIIIYKGVHEFLIDEDTQFLEIKQGPFDLEKGKVRYDTRLHQ